MRIFISYRRAVTAGQAGRLQDRLAKAFGKQNVFLDVKGIPAGATFESYILKKIDECDVFLALLAKGTFDRIHDPEDWVRREIAYALASKTRIVVPILINGFEMPKEDELPEDIRALTGHHAEVLIDQIFDETSKLIIKRIKESVAIRDNKKHHKQYLLRLAAFVATIVLIGLALLIVSRPQNTGVLSNITVTPTGTGVKKTPTDTLLLSETLPNTTLVPSATRIETALSYSQTPTILIPASITPSNTPTQIRIALKPRTFENYIETNKHDIDVGCAVLSSDNQYVLSAAEYKSSIPTVSSMWNAVTGELIHTFKEHQLGVSDCTFSPDNKYVLTGSRDKSAKLWSTETGELVRTFKDNFLIGSVAFSHNGKYIITATRSYWWSGNNKTISIWDVNDGNKALTITDTSPIFGAIFSPDDKYILTGNANGTAMLWEAESGNRIKTFSNPSKSGVNDLAFMSDGQYIFIAHTNGTVVLWDIATSTKVRTFDISKFGRNNTIESIAISPDDKYLLGGGLVRAHIWEIATGTEIKQFKPDPNKPSYIESVAFSHDGKYILLGSGGFGTVHLMESGIGN